MLITTIHKKSSHQAKKHTRAAFFPLPYARRITHQKRSLPGGWGILNKLHANRMPLAGSYITFEDPASGRCPLQFNLKNSTVPSLPALNVIMVII